MSKFIPGVLNIFVLKSLFFVLIFLYTLKGYSQAPAISSFNPVSGSKYASINIQGTNFTGTTSVKFGGVPAINFFVASPNYIYATVDTGASGDVSVTSPNGTSSKVGFTYIPAPLVKSFFPVQGGVNTAVKIVGSFLSGVTSVTFGGIPALTFSVLSDTIITAVVGSGNSGQVSVRGPNGQSYLDGFTHLGPTITSYTPTAGSEIQITLTGTNFITANLVTIGGVPVSSYTVNSATSISAVTAPGSSGTIAVTTQYGTGFSSGFNLPTIFSFAPQSGSTDTPVIIKGRNFTGVTDVSFGNVAAKSFTVFSDTALTAVVGLGESGAIKAGNIYGKGVLYYFNYIYLPSSIVSFSAASGKEGDTITIRGNHFTSANNVYFGNTAASSFRVASDTVIVAIVGKGASGDVSVYTSANSSSISGFIFTGPSISYFNPTAAFKGTIVDIVGSNFSGVSAVSFGGTPASSFKVLTTALIQAVVGDGSPGDIVVNTSSGSAVKSSFFMKPLIYSFTPARGGPGTTVLIKGRYFSNAYSVNFGSVQAASFSINSDTVITAIVGSGNSGDVSVATSGGGTGSLNGFVFIPLPNIYEISPLYGGNGTAIYITGRYFTGTTNVKIGNVDAISFTVVDDYNITAFIGNGASGPISVTTASGIKSEGYFTYYEKPVITSFTPNSCGPATQVIIRGRHLNSTVFLGNGSSQHLTVTFGGVPSLNPTSISDTVITARVAAGASGYVYVETPGGSDYMPGFILKTVPAITSFSPSSGPVGTIVTLTGTNFSSVANNNIVYFGGVKATIITATANSITTSVPSGATFEPISVTVNSLTTYTKKPFVVSYSGFNNFSSNSYTSRIDFPVGLTPKALLGDVDGDGKLDMVIGNYKSNTVEIFLNNSTIDSISFAPKIVLQTCLLPLIKIVKDFDGDGKLDILLISETDFDYQRRIYVMFNKSIAGKISFSQPIAVCIANYSSDLKVADLNNDGRPDITFSMQYGTTAGLETIGFRMNDISDTVYKFSTTQNDANVSNGKIDNNAFGFSKSLALADLDNNGKTDVIVGIYAPFPSNLEYYFTILKNSTPYATAILDMPKINITAANSKTDNPQVGDLNLDSLPDIIRDTVAYINTGNFNFTQAINTCVNCEFVTDMDGDGIPDLVNITRDTVGIVRNKTVNGVVTLAPKVSFYTGSHASFYVIGDLNGDSKPEIVISRYDDNSISILKNKVGQVFTLCSNGSTNIVSNIKGKNYQWQQNKGAGFINISDNSTFRGTNSDTLFLKNVNDTSYEYKYRCLVDTNYSYSFNLKFESSWLGTTSTAWETNANWACNNLPDANTDVILTSGKVVLSSNGICRSIIIQPGATFTIMPGFTLTVTH